MHLIEICPGVFKVDQAFSLKIFNNMTNDFLCFVGGIQFFTLYLKRKQRPSGGMFDVLTSEAVGDRGV